MHAHPPPGAPPFEIASIFREHAGAYRRQYPSLSREQHRVLADLERCRTPALGGHLYRCEQCRSEVVLHNSCLNRHCPSCQGPAQFRWVEQRKTRLLPTTYFHVVFTLPALVRPLARRYRRLLFDLLFSTAARTLLDLGRDPKRLGATLGFTLVLHTWKRDLHFHPHVHGIVTGGGLDAEADRWVPTRQDYLLPGQVLSRVFRGKFLEGLIDLYQDGAFELDPQAFRNLIRQLKRKHWVVYAKRPFGGPEQIVRYLGLYTHRVAISNHRLLAVSPGAVTFRTRGEGTCTVAPHEFIRRFLLHVLPDRFVKIRHYGLLAPANVNRALRRAQQLLPAQPVAAQIDPTNAALYDPDVLTHSEQPAKNHRPRCPRCAARALIRVASTHHSPYRPRSPRCAPPPDT